MSTICIQIENRMDKLTFFTFKNSLTELTVSKLLVVSRSLLHSSRYLPLYQTEKETKKPSGKIKLILL